MRFSSTDQTALFLAGLPYVTPCTTTLPSCGLVSDVPHVSPTAGPLGTLTPCPDNSTVLPIVAVEIGPSYNRGWRWATEGWKLRAIAGLDGASSNSTVMSAA